jgi:serine/threonine-protein kinase
MAEVQLAIQRGPAGFEKLVVVKLVHENLVAQKGFVDMLLEEAKVAALVKHPNVVDIYDLGEAEGRYFIAMEYLEGEPLLAVLRAGREGKRLDTMSTARLIADTAEGLDAAHELRTMAGDPIELVHHDVSLGNIVVLYNGQVKLVDFGVAKATQSATAVGPARARVQGKFSYMAPEKLRGSAGDRRSDIWSLGCVLWEALTLRRLFKGGNDNETMRQVLETEIALPSSVNGEVSAEFDPIVMKALQRDPVLRYATAKEMAADLEEVLRQNKYGGKNDVIAKYMQATFGDHIVARKKLLQEVSSKGRASADILEAAFNEPQLASGSPVLSDFSVKFRRPTGEIEATASPLGETKRPSQELPATRPKSQSSNPPFAADGTPAATGTVAALRALAPKKQLALAGGALLLVIVIVAVAFGGGGSAKHAAAADPDRGSAQPVIVATPDAALAVVQTPDAAVVVAPAPDAAVEDIDMAAGSGEGSDETETTPPPANPPGKKPVVSQNTTPKQGAQELFKTGMQAYVKGDSKTAITHFRKALQANSGFANAWRALGFAQEKVGEWGQAKTAFQKYLQLAPNASDAAQIRERIGRL